MLCRACHFDLRGSIDVGRCPGCGRDFHPRDSLSFLAERPKPPSWGDRLDRLTCAMIALAGAAYVVRLLIALTGGGH